MPSLVFTKAIRYILLYTYIIASCMFIKYSTHNIFHTHVGVSVVRDQLNIGISATASCFSDAPATRMEWLQNGVVIASDTSTQRLDLEFSPVSDSIHNLVYICRVTRQGGAQAEQNFTAIVDGN